LIKLANKIKEISKLILKEEIRTRKQVSAIIEEQELSKDDLLTMFRQILEIHALEDNITNLLSKAVLQDASHLYAGQETVAVGTSAALRDDDLITSPHRGHRQGHAHGDKVTQTPEAQQSHSNKMMAEVRGHTGDGCKGKGGLMHIANDNRGTLVATRIVSENIPVAVGAGLAQKLQGIDNVVMCFFGDGVSTALLATLEEGMSA
jgi:TPP-dependent pyruvate/acetoin dehydrogenase alpha subunit